MNPSRSNFRLSVESYWRLLVFISLFFDWSGKLAPFSRLMRCKTKLNRDSSLDFSLFPYFGHYYCLHCDISFAPCDVFLGFLSCCDYFCFVSTTRNRNSLQPRNCGRFANEQFAGVS